MIACSKKTVVALVLAVACGFAAPSTAQELSLGYQVQHFSSDGDGLTAPLGVNISVAGRGALTGVGQFDWSRKRESESVLGTSFDATASFTAFAGGLRWSDRGRRSATPFVHALFGAMRSSGSARIAGAKVGSASETDPMLQFGGGVASRMAGALHAFGQVDYRRIFDDAAGVNSISF